MKQNIHVVVLCIINGITLSTLFACATRTSPAPIVSVTTPPGYVMNDTGGTATMATPSSSVPSSPVQIAASNDSNKLIVTNNNSKQPGKVNTVDNSSSGSSPSMNKSASGNQAPTNSQPQIQTGIASSTPAKQHNQPTSNSQIVWQKPTSGTLIGKYSSANKGIDYTGSIGQPIFAASSGKVLYSGNGLKGYGNLIIIMHDKVYLSAYAHNKVNLVSQGTIVQRGQKIGLMGQGDQGTPLLHFEIRKSGTPTDPSPLLGN